MLKHRKLFSAILSILLILSLTLPVNAMTLTENGTTHGNHAGISGGVLEEQDPYVVTESAEGKCTGFYMGKDTTENGSYIWGRSEDYSSDFAKLFDVRLAADHAPGEKYVSGYTDFTWDYPAHTFRYIMCKDSDAANGPYSTDEAYAAVGMNEKNVAISASVTLSNSKKAILDEDPMQKYGLEESDVVSIVLMQAETARHGCEILAEIYDKEDGVGAYSRDGIMISDPNEVWYFQSLSGHQYVAIKCPDDMIGFSPNITGNVGRGDVYTIISDAENVIASDDLIKLPQKLGVLVGDDTKIKIADTYASGMSDHQSGRLRLGHYYLKGAEDVLAQPKSAYMDYFLEPREGKKYSLYEAMRFLGYRGEGSPYEVANPTSNRYSISNDNTMESHAFETRPGLPDALATVEWLCMGPAEFGVYLPYYGSLITETAEVYHNPDTAKYNSADPDANNAYWVFRELYTQCAATTLEERSRLGDGVKAFWERYQKSLIAQQASVDTYMQKIYSNSPKLAEEKATEISVKLSEETYQYAKKILAELKAFKAAGTTGDFVPSALLDENALPHYAPTESSSKGRSSSSNNTTTTTKNSDGSTTTTTTNLVTGTVTKVTKHPDGSEITMETQKNGTVTTTEKDTAGNITKTVKKSDGSSTTTVNNKDGSSSTTTVDEKGKVKVTATLSSKAVEALNQGEAASLPLSEVSASRDRDSAPTITINGPDNKAVKVEIPVKNAKAGTVVILVHPDGREEIIKNAVVTSNGVVITVKGSVIVKIVDNSKDFTDVAKSFWAHDAVGFVSSRELFSGTSSTAFSPNEHMTRAMLMAVLARLDGQDTTGGETWYSKAAEWSKNAGVSDGSNPNGLINREQLASMLHRYALNRGMNSAQSGAKIQEFSDYERISDYATEAMAWCVNTGLISGMGDNTLNPQGYASRAQVAAILTRFCEKGMNP